MPILRNNNILCNLYKKSKIKAAMNTYIFFERSFKSKINALNLHLDSPNIDGNT